MAAKMTERENYLRVLRGEPAEWIPNYWDACIWGGPVVYQNKVIPGSGNPNKKIVDLMGFEHNERERYTDMLGIEWTITIDGAFPTPGKITVTDITKWKEQINYPFPDLNEIDFKTQAEMFNSKVDRNEKALAYMSGGLFMALINCMGVAEGLCAMFEEPEACHEFFKYFTDYEEQKIRLSFPYFKPEVVIIGDDVANVRNLFFSPEMYDDLIAPYHRQLAKAVLELGAIAEMHCCGHCEQLIPKWVDMGITVWQPAQPVNDLKGIKAKYGQKLILNGCWDTKGKGGMVGASEETVRESVRETIDEIGSAGDFVFWDGGITGGDEQKFGWTSDEARKYGRSYYKTKYATVNNE